MLIQDSVIDLDTDVVALIETEIADLQDGVDNLDEDVVKLGDRDCSDSKQRQQSRFRCCCSDRDGNC